MTVLRVSHSNRQITSFEPSERMGHSQKISQAASRAIHRNRVETSAEEIRQKKRIATHKLLESHYEPHLPGCNVVVMREGRILDHHSCGLADVDGKLKMNIDQPQHFGSVSKQFTAMSILLLVEDGKVNLDADIRTILPEFPKCFFRGEERIITVRNLLEMRSGLPEVLAYAYFAGRQDQDLTAQEKLAPLLKHEKVTLSFIPGTEKRYCNTNYYLLSELVYRASGMTLKDYAENNIFKKLGMHSTHFIDPTQPVLRQSIKGYSVNPVRECTTQNATWGACGVIGTPRDMALWDANFTHNLLGKKSPKLIQDFVALPHSHLKTDELEYGKGLNVGFLKNYKIECHSGGIEGFTTEFVRVTNVLNPKDHVSIFLSSNRELNSQETVRHLARDIANIWMDKFVFPKELEKPKEQMPKQEVQTPAQKKKLFNELRAYTGKYTCAILETLYACSIEERQGKVGLSLKAANDKEIAFLIQHPKHKGFFDVVNIPSLQFRFSAIKNALLLTDFSQGIIQLPLISRG